MVNSSFVAKQLHEYMTFRANRENVCHTLTVSFYVKSLKRGFRNLFGVEVDESGLLFDIQQPELFAEWNAKKH